MATKRTHLSLIVIDKATRQPAAGLPFYAEVVTPLVLTTPEIEPDDRFDEVIDAVLGKLDAPCRKDQACRARTKAAIQRGLARVLLQTTRDQLTVNEPAVRRLIEELIRDAQRAGGGSLASLSDAALAEAVEKALRASADRFGIATTPEGSAHTPAKSTTAYPLGILATDHVGYLSFDLTRLPADIYETLMAAVDLRRNDREAVLEVSVWFYAFGLEALRLDALEQGRFSNEAVLTKFEFEVTKYPRCGNMDGMLSMQNPSLTDWRLSPASFAISPRALIGADGCETLLPANTALHEFNFHQVVGIPVADVGLPLPAASAGRVRPGFVNEYRLSFVPIGHSLGQILYTFPLAPAESVNFAVIDWTRRDSAMRNETTKFDESLVHELRRDRMITETVRASIDEWQHGGSVMGGMATSAGGAMGAQGMGLAAGASNAIGGAYSTTSGSRDIGAETVQKLSDNVAQAASSSRELYSTVVVQSSQAEHEAIETRTVVNYNHSHALTIVYYEILRHFRLVTEFVRRRPVLLTNIHGGILGPPGIGGAPSVNWPIIYQNRKVIEGALLDERHRAGLDAIEARRHRERTAAAAKAYSTPSAPVAPGDRKFGFFTFEMKTGGFFSTGMDDHANVVELTADLIGPSPTVNLVDPAGGTILNQRGSFRQADAVNTFVAVLKVGQQPIEWNSLYAIFFWINPQSGGDTHKVSFQHIKVTATDADGGTEVLIDQPYEAGHLIVMNEGAHIALPTRRPPPVLTLGPGAERIEEDVRVDAFAEHLVNQRAHYERALRLGSTPAQRGFELASFDVGGGASLLEKVDNRPLEVLGDYVAYPSIDPDWSQKIIDALKPGIPEIPTIERLITLPSRGVFAEAKLGHCNASEEIDPTRFWDWQQSPIPHFAPEIAAVTAVTPQPQSPGGLLQPTAFPQPLVNIVNPPSAPDPQGMTAALTALATANIFRDMSGRAEVADLLKKLSDNSVAIAQAAQKAAAPSTPGTGSPSGTAGGGTVSGGETTPVPSNRPPEAQSAPVEHRTPEQRESEQLDNTAKKGQIKTTLPPPLRKKVDEQMTNELTKTKTPWRIVFTSEWNGQGIAMQPMAATYHGYLRFGQLVDDYVSLNEIFTNTEAIWDANHEGFPLILHISAQDPRPPDGAIFTVQVPAISVPGVGTLKAKAYDVPLRSGVPALPATLEHTLNIKTADPKSPSLHFHAVGTIDRKDIEVFSEVDSSMELGGDFGKEFSSEATVEIVKLALKSTLKAAVKATVGGKVGIKGTYEILYWKGYEVKQV